MDRACFLEKLRSYILDHGNICFQGAGEYAAIQELCREAGLPVYEGKLEDRSWRYASLGYMDTETVHFASGPMQRHREIIDINELEDQLCGNRWEDSTPPLDDLIRAIEKE